MQLVIFGNNNSNKNILTQKKIKITGFAAVMRAQVYSKLQQYITNIDYYKEWLLTISLKTENTCITVISTYALDITKSREATSTCY